MSQTERTYRPGEAAAVCGVPVRTVLRAISRAELGAIRYNARVICITHADLLAWRVAKLTAKPLSR